MVTARFRAPQAKACKVNVRKGVSSAFAIADPGGDIDRLTITINHQLAALRVVGGKQKRNAISNALNLIRGEAASSPINLILCLLHVTRDTVQAGTQFEILANTILSYCVGLSKSNDETACKGTAFARPGESFELQTYAMRAKVCMMRTTGCTASVQDAIITPFSKCLAAYVRRSHTSIVETYSLANELTQNFLRELDLQQTNVKSPFTDFNCLLGVYDPLSSLALVAGLPKEALRWLEAACKSHEPIRGRSSVGTSAAAATARLVQMAAIALEVLLLDGSIEITRRCLKEAAIALKEESFCVMVDARFARSAIDLYKAILSYSRSVVAPNRSTAADPQETLRQLCQSVASSCLSLCRRMLQARLCPPSDTQNLESEAALRPLYQAAESGVGWTVHCAMRIRPGESDSDTLLSILKDLECCTKLALLLADRPSMEETGCGAAPSSLVHVSNAWLALYLATKDTSQDHALHALKQSCRTLELGPKADKSLANLPARLSKLGRVLRSHDQWHDGFTAFTKALEVSLDLSLLKKALAQCESESVDAGIWRMSECKVIDEALQSMLELAAEHGIQELKPRGYFDSEALDLNQRRALIDRQLLILSRTTTSTALWTHAIEVIPLLSTILLDMYDSAREALARGRILLRLFPLALEKRGDFKQDFLKGLEWRTTSTITILYDRKYEHNRYRASYIQSLLQACLVLRDHKSNHGLVEEILSTWHRLLDNVTTGDPILQTFADIEEWSRLAQSVADHLYVVGSGINRLSTLRFMMRLEATSSSVIAHQTSSWTLEFSTELLRMGYSELGGLQLETIYKRTDMLIDTKCRSQLLLAYAEYYLILGSTERCHSNLREFCNLRFEIAKEALTSLSMKDKVRLICETCDYHHISSRLACSMHCLELAEQHVRLQCSALREVWQTIAEQKNARQPNLKQSKSKLGSERSSSPIRELAPPLTDACNQTRNQSSAGLTLIAMQILLPRLTRAYDQAAELSSLCGQYHGTAHSVEQSRRLTENLPLPYLQATALARKGDYMVRGGELQAGSGDLSRAMGMYQDFEPDLRLVAHHQAYGHYHHLCRQWQPELQTYHKAGVLLYSLEKSTVLRALVAGAPLISNGNLSTKKKAFVIDQKQKASRKPRQVSSAGAKAHTIMKSINSQPPTKEPESTVPAAMLRTLRADLISLEAQSLLAQRDVDRCKSLLQDVSIKLLPTTTTDRLSVAWSRMCFVEALNTTTTDAVFSMLPESSISMPAALLSDHDSVEATFEEMRLDCPTNKSGRVQKGPVKGPPAPSDEIIQSLYHALKWTIARQDSILTSLPLAELIIACSCFVSASMMLSYVNANLASSLVDPARVAFWLALPSSTAAARDRSSILGETLAKSNSNHVTPISITSSPRHLFTEHAKDHTNFIDLIPKTWNIISISRDHDDEHIFLTQYRSARQPLIIRLPLSRQNDGTDDEDSFSFADAKEELTNIINGSEATIHSARDNPDQFKIKGTRTQWWEGREGLDKRLGILLTNIENMWFGGFRCLFSKHKPDEDLLARFQQSFVIILDKHLPSRQQSRQRAANNKVKLDRHVLELFVGLGPSDYDNDLDEPLTDLLYYVVDILQFNGELNAYDEIDFDAIIVEVQSALESYHEAFQVSEQGESISHTVLVLDKELHAFPWESMPCLRDRSVSRVHSVLDLQERLASSSLLIAPNDKERHQQVSAHKGTYILNPGRDLPQTQARFERPLSTLTSGPSNWSSTVAKEPSEQEFLFALYPPSTSEEKQENRILVYIGHGSGEQYVRHHKLKQLRYQHWTPPPISSSPASSIDSTAPSKAETPTMNPSISVALLFGCSSASLKLHSEFEPHGTPKSYMAAGAPALLGSLWDVTDGDVDRFAGGVLERWGLLERGTCEIQEAKLAAAGKRKGKAGKTTAIGREKDEPDFGSMSLTEAVARSRGECYLKYLNGAAMVVYGVPVFLDKTA